MRDYIEIEKTELPISFDIVLGSEQFNMYIKYNEACDLFTCTLSKDDEVLVYDEPIIYGVPLFTDVYDAEDFPCLDIVAYDESCTETEVTYNNFGQRVLLTIEGSGNEQ